MRILLVAPLLAALLLLAGCSRTRPTAVPSTARGAADYSVYVALGTSISAGWQSGGVVDRHQTRAFPALFARLARSSRFDQPLVNGDGLPPLSRIVQFGPPLLISNQGRAPGSPTNAALPTAYHHLAVPFAVLPDVTDTTAYYTTTQGRALMFDLVQRHRGSLLAQVAGQIGPPPTFITFEFGSNELLGPASRGLGTPQIPAASWAALLTFTLDALQSLLPNAKLALFTVPDVTTIPLVTTIPPLVLGANGRPVTPFAPLLGPGNAPLTPGQDFVLLTASPLLAAGYGYPVGTTSYVSGGPVAGNGIGLADSLVLTAAEIASLRAAVNAYNAAIVNEATLRGAALVDMAALLRQGSTTGFTIQGTTYTSAFLTGGLFSLDGAHPTDLAQAILCNALIDAVNATFGSGLPHANLGEAQTFRSDGARPPRGEDPVMPLANDAAAALPALFPWRGSWMP